MDNSENSREPQNRRKAVAVGIYVAVCLIAGGVLAYLSDFFSAPANMDRRIAIIGCLNLFLAGFVLVDLRFLRPAKTVSDYPPAASKSFKQIIWGWEMLWGTWIAFYFLMTLQWLKLVEPAYENWIWIVSDALNIVNGFFFYYLFLVSDKPSVAIQGEPKRAAIFWKGIALTVSVGLLCLGISIFMKLAFPADAPPGLGFLTKMVSTYIAVGMAFFFGRLDSHNLEIPRLFLAPFYLYAIIQSFWGPHVVADPDTVVIFGLALILKFFMFLTLSKWIKDDFYEYLIASEKEYRRKQMEKWGLDT